MLEGIVIFGIAVILSSIDLTDSFYVSKTPSDRFEPYILSVVTAL